MAVSTKEEEVMRFTSIEPTPFFAYHGGELRHLVQIGLDDVEAEVRSHDTRVHLRAPHVDEMLNLGALSSENKTYDAWFPDLAQPAEIRLGLYLGQELHDERTLPWQPQRKWEVHLIHYAHHDLGYTDLPSRVLREYEGFMDQVLDYCRETEGWPEQEARFRYQCEQAWSVVHYLEHRPPEMTRRLAHYCHTGQIEVTALYGNQTLELCSHEELVRLLYPAFRLKRELGIEITSAEHNDIPGFTWGLASVLAGAGIRYFSPGVPLWYFHGVHPLWDTDAALPLGMPAACWWEGPDGARVLLWSDLHGQEWQPYNYEQAQH